MGFVRGGRAIGWGGCGCLWGGSSLRKYHPVRARGGYLCGGSISVEVLCVVQDVGGPYCSA